MCPSVEMIRRQIPTFIWFSCSVFIVVCVCLFVCLFACLFVFAGRWALFICLNVRRLLRVRFFLLLLFFFFFFEVWWRGSGGGGGRGVEIKITSTGLNVVSVTHTFLGLRVVLILMFPSFNTQRKGQQPKQYFNFLSFPSSFFERCVFFTYIFVRRLLWVCFLFLLLLFSVSSSGRGECRCVCVWGGGGEGWGCGGGGGGVGGGGGGGGVVVAWRGRWRTGATEIFQRLFSLF